MFNIICRPLTAKIVIKFYGFFKGGSVSLPGVTGQSFGSVFLKKAHYPYRAIEKDPFAKNKTDVFHIIILL